MTRYLFALFIVMGMVTGASASGDKYQITAAEKQACASDAMRLCQATYPNEDKLMSCLKSNRASLDAGCATAFDAGLKRRGFD